MPRAPQPPDDAPKPPAPAGRSRRLDMAPVIPVAPPDPTQTMDVAIGATAPRDGGVITARRAGGLRDIGLEVDPRKCGVPEALQHLAKAINIAFQTDYGENYLEAVYQAAVVTDDEVRIFHKEYFGFGKSWFAQFGRLLKSMNLSFAGPDPGSPEGQKRIQDNGPATIRGLLNLVGRKMDLVPEYEDRVPAYVGQMFDRLEGSGIIQGWHREDWNIRTTRIGLDIRIWPADRLVEELRVARQEMATKPKRGEKGTT